MTSFLHADPRLLNLRSRVCLGAGSLVAVALVWVFLLSSGGVSGPGVVAPGVRAPASATAAGSAGTSGVSGALAHAAAANPRQRVEVIIQFRRGVDAAREHALVRSLGGQPGLNLRIINGLSARMSAGAAQRLAASSLVHAVSLNAGIKRTTLAQ